jgi:hypothetical protein
MIARIFVEFVQAVAVAAVLIAGVVVLAGCATQQVDLQIPKETRVPTPVPCIDPMDVPAAPVTRTASELFLMHNGIRTDAIYADWLRLKAYADVAAVVIDKCSRIPQPTRLKVVP